MAGGGRGLAGAVRTVLSVTFLLRRLEDNSEWGGDDCPHSPWRRGGRTTARRANKPQRSAPAYIVFGKRLLDKVGVSSFPPLIILKSLSSGWVTSNFHKWSFWDFFFLFLMSFNYSYSFASSKTWSCLHVELGWIGFIFPILTQQVAVLNLK